jgi:hypothetical protein
VQGTCVDCSQSYPHEHNHSTIEDGA